MAFDANNPAGLEELLKALRPEDQGVTPPPGLLMPPPGAAQPAPAPVAPAPAAPAPPPTDDPGLAMPAIPKPPDLSNSPLAQLLTKTNQDQAAIAAVPKPDPAQLKPRLWERILGGVLGATQLRNPENAGAVADQVVHRRLRGAQNDYEVKTGPLYKQLEVDRGGLGAAEAQSRIPQQDFQNQMEVTREGRQQTLDTGRIGQYRARAESLQGKFIAGTEQEDKNSPTGWTAETAEGERKPFSPKSATTPPKEPKNADEALSAASATKDPDEKTRLTKLAHDMLLNDVKRARANKSDPNAPKPPSRSQSRLIETKKQADLAKAEHEYSLAVEDAGGDYESKSAKSALDALNKRKQQIQSAYEAEIEANGGSVSDGGSSPAPAAVGKPAPAAASASPAGKVFNVSKWKSANPNGDATAAKTEAQRQGYKIKE